MDSGVDIGCKLWIPAMDVNLGGNTLVFKEKGVAARPHLCHAIIVHLTDFQRSMDHRMCEGSI